MIYKKTYDRSSINHNFIISNTLLKELIEFSINEGLINILKTKEYFNEKYIDLLNNIKNNFDTIPDIYKKSIINFIEIYDNEKILINLNYGETSEKNLPSNFFINTNSNITLDETSNKDDIKKKLENELNKSDFKKDLIDYVYNFSDISNLIPIYKNDEYEFYIQIFDGYYEESYYNEEGSYYVDNSEHQKYLDEEFEKQYTFTKNETKYTIEFKYRKTTYLGKNIGSSKYFSRSQFEKVSLDDIGSKIDLDLTKDIKERLVYDEDKHFNDLNKMVDEIIFLHNTLNLSKDNVISINEVKDKDLLNLNKKITINYDNNENLKVLNVLLNLYTKEYNPIEMLKNLHKEDVNFIKNNI